jgi:catechol 2,3-dioxygenase-like lactoylglutathione lyase family enzyme
MSIQFQIPDYFIVYVSDMQRSVAFYRDVLGLPMKFTSPGWTEFATGSTTVALHGAGTAPSGAEQVSLPPSGQAQLGFMVDDLQAPYEALVAFDVHFSFSKGIDIGDLDLNGLDSAGIRALKIKALEKEKTELSEKLRLTWRRIDHLERAFRLEERKHLPEDEARQRERDLTAYEQANKETLKESEQKHKDAVALKHRLGRLTSVYESFRNEVKEQRKAEFERRQRKAQQELQSKMEQRRREYRERKAREQREREEADRKRREEEERIAREAEERARADEERRQKLAEEKDPAGGSVPDVTRQLVID